MKIARSFQLAAFAVAAVCTTSADATKTAPADIGATAPAQAAPQSSAGNRDERSVVAIYEFRSGVPEVGARATTDLFVTALVRSGQFRVVERARVSEGVIKEKQLGAQNLATGDAGNAPLQGARYLFEGAVTEANASQDQRSSGVSIGGMEVGRGSNRDVIAIDVRVLDVKTGEILDVVTVRRDIGATNSKVAGVGNLLSAVMATGGGRAIAIVPDFHVEQQHKESLDGALRSAIEEAVHELATKFAH